VGFATGATMLNKYYVVVVKDLELTGFSTLFWLVSN
jgi:hypothetical protein